MSDDVKPIPKWKTDPALAHIPITEEGVARWRERFKELDKRREQEWAELRERIGLPPR